MSITTTYDREADAVFIAFGPRARPARTIVATAGVHVDLDRAGRVVGIEVLQASARMAESALADLASPDEWLSLPEAAAVANLKATTLRVQINNGRIAGEKHGRDWFIARHVLDTYLDEVEQRVSRQAPVPAQAHETIRRVSLRLQRLKSESSVRVQHILPTIGAKVMGKNEKSSTSAASLAGKVLSGSKKPTTADAKKLAASVLTQAPDKPKKSGKK